MGRIPIKQLRKRLEGMPAESAATSIDSTYVIRKHAASYRNAQLSCSISRSTTSTCPTKQKPALDTLVPTRIVRRRFVHIQVRLADTTTPLLIIHSGCTVNLLAKEERHEQGTAHGGGHGDDRLIFMLSQLGTILAELIEGLEGKSLSYEVAVEGAKAQLSWVLKELSEG